MKIKELCNVMYDNERVEIYDSRRNMDLLHHSTAARLRLDREWGEKEIYTVKPSTRVMLVYLGC